MTSAPLRILMIEDNPDDAALIAEGLARHGLTFTFERIDTEDALQQRLSEETWDVILSGSRLPGFDGHRALEIVRETEIATPFIVVSRAIGEDIAVEYMRAGVSDYVLKKSLERLGPAVERAVRELHAHAKQRKVEETRSALRQTVSRYEALLEAAPIALYDGDAGGAYATNWISENVRTITGFASSSFLAEPDFWVSRIHPQDAARVLAQIDRQLARGDEYASEYRWRNADESYRWYLDRGRAVRDDAGGAVQRIGAFQDVSELKELERQLAGVQRMEAVGRLAGGVAHDFNNMLAVIIGRVEMIHRQMKPDNPDYAALDEIMKAAMRSADLTRQLLAFARRQTIAPKMLDLNDTVEKSLEKLGRLIGEHIELAWKPATGLWTVKMDPVQVDQILVNLCVNARDAISGTGKVTIETGNVALDDAYCATHARFVPGEYTMLAVSDDGCGMDEEMRSHAFEPFFTTKEQGEGTGLGLATIYGIVKQNEGYINVYSEPGHGTSFKIYIPRQEGTRAEVIKESPTDVPRGRGETVLLVDDEAAILATAEAMLEELGYLVLTAVSPEDAIDLVRTYDGAVDLLLTDVVMPGMSGGDLSERLREARPELKVLFMSGYTANVIAHHGVIDEVVNFLQKPFHLRALALKVRDVLDEPSP